MTQEPEISQEAARAMLAALRGCLAAMEAMYLDATGDMTAQNAADLWNAAVDAATDAIALAERGA